MTERYLLFDAECSTCAHLASEIEKISDGRLTVRNLRDAKM
ncbi:MAG: hypothetical protein GFH27_549285n63 [Chloroflexi bacterium AL-W]|nr:hypothetical protein [Chloroflexi bacterium AL-N1]NOK65575.1 hypothetical protein [Chloroflexi bacterium AL-N10]NOK74484.1 hypothetical protein [Chloroflexi bacterium AL-N5]NOK80608.1 hypothetical protein [Chloroflexi bacterium AL-W]NOK88742.1 hypothetical protein [Chloroflexi bacterium AL-N15]